MFIMTLMGFSSGLPIALVVSTLQGWMTKEGVDLTLIGIFALVQFPYTLKFLWAPFLDRYRLPIFGPAFGRRRSWALASQLLLFVSIFQMSMFNPAANPWIIAGLAVVVAFFSATQDIVLDAYRAEYLDGEEYGIGAGVYILGYRVAMIVSGGLAFILADQIPWPQVYQIMAGCMIIGMLTTIFAAEPKLTRTPRTLREAVFEPLIEILSRRGIIEILLFVLLYKLDAVISMAMLTPFLLKTGFTQTDIGVVTKAFGLVSTIGGTILGGILMIRWGLKKSLWIFGILQGVAGASFVLIAHYGAVHGLLVFAIAAENICSGMGNAAYVAFLMALCDLRFTGTQYALLSSIMALTRMVTGTPMGWLSKTVGWEMYFIISMLAAIPGLALLTRFDRWDLKNAK